MHILRKNKLGILLLVGPAFALFTYFIIRAVIMTGYYSLTVWDAVSPPKFTGFANYVRLFASADFHIVLRNNIVGMVIALILQLGFGLTIAYLIFRTVKGMRMYRAISFIPVVMAPAAIAILFVLLLNGDLGPINQLLNDMGLGFLARNWLSDTDVVFYSVLTPMIYQYFGMYILIYIAGMQSIEKEIFESAEIDGANSFQLFTRIVIPTQINITLMCAILIISGGLKAFEHAWLMTWGGPGVRSSFLGVFMYTQSFQGGQFGRGSAVAIVILVLSVFFTVVLQRIVKRYEY